MVDEKTMALFGFATSVASWLWVVGSIHSAFLGFQWLYFLLRYGVVPLPQAMSSEQVY
jgi:hypothetical protein